MLYKRNYHLGLTEEEKQQYEEVTGRKFGEKRVNGFGSVNNFLTYPKAARMCKSLFPNNYLDVTELHDVERLGYANEEFFSLLNNERCTERDILNFIKEKEYYHIIGSIIWGLTINIGNHGAYEYSCAMKSHFRKSGNQMTGRRKSSNARLLAQCFI